MQQEESLCTTSFSVIFTEYISTLLSYQLVLKKVKTFIQTVTPIYRKDALKFISFLSAFCSHNIKWWFSCEINSKAKLQVMQIFSRCCV